MPSWTKEREQFVEEKWKDGYSAAQIARMLGDVTRNAVIGKIVRLGLTGQGEGVRKRRRRTQGRTKPKPKTVPKPLPVIPEPERHSDITRHPTLLELRDGICKWAINDGGPFRFCGAATGSPLKPYCAHHHRRAWETVSEARRRRVEKKAAA